jgi:hypothetical protein
VVGSFAIQQDPKYCSLCSGGGIGIRATLRSLCLQHGIGVRVPSGALVGERSSRRLKTGVDSRGNPERLESPIKTVKQFGWWKNQLGVG